MSSWPDNHLILMNIFQFSSKRLKLKFDKIWNSKSKYCIVDTKKQTLKCTIYFEYHMTSNIMHIY